MASAVSVMMLTGCSSTVLSHGNQLDPVSLAKIQPGKTRLIEVEALFGRPSIEGVFESGRVYYVTQIMEEKPAGRKETISRTIISFSYDDRGVVQAMDITDENSGRNIYHLDASTPTPGDNYGALEQIFRNVRSGNIGQ
ncbi:MAG: outer membrane protein assembly factor BamE [Alphaproteobacteria bacterium]|nr:outer membrane protein assembly factor BamE [Alphaproteobacteria bacterium]